jgi:hypothetical protein
VVSAVIIGAGFVGFLTWMGLVFRDLWNERPILVPDPKWPGRKQRYVGQNVRRDKNGWRHHGQG